jgi:hypothetical protein
LSQKLSGEYCKTISKCCVAVGSIALGVGTLFLGLTAFWKANDIYEVVTHIQNLTQMVSSLKDIENQNGIILKRIDKQIEFSSENYATKFSENNAKTRMELKPLTSKINASVLSEPPTSETGPVAYYHAKHTSKNEDDIFIHWDSLKTPEQRIKYLSQVFEKYLKSDKLEPKKTDD